MLETFAFKEVAKSIGVKGFVIIGLVITIIVMKLMMNGLRSDLGEAQTKIGRIETRLEVSNSSIDTLEAVLAKYIGDGNARKLAGLAARQAQAERSAALSGQIHRIRAEIASVGNSGRCLTPESIRQAEGL